MASLLDLPNELLANIISNTYREDLVNFAVTNKRIHTLAESALGRHRELQAEYSGVFHPHSDSGALARLVVDIIQDPEIGLYVTDLAIDGWYDEWTTEYQGLESPMHSEYPQFVMSCLQEAIRTEPYLNDQVRDYWLEHLEMGDEDPLIALLISHLPNLSKLTIRTERLSAFLAADCTCLHVVLDEVLKTPSRSLLSKLRAVELDSSGSQSFHTFKRLIRIPSLRIMRASHMQARIDDASLSASIERSAIRTLMLEDCEMETEPTASAIESMQSLECFSYNAIDMDDDAAEIQPNPYWIRVSLLATVRDTLRFFQYLPHPVKEDSVTPSVVHRHLGSLRGFRALETIIVDCLLLFGGDLLGCHTFASELPRSIRNLLLHVGGVEIDTDSSEDDSSLTSNNISEDSDERQQTSQVPSSKKNIRAAAELPGIRAPTLNVALYRLLDEKEQHLPHLSNLKILGLEEEVVREVSSSDIVKKCSVVGVEFSMAAMYSHEAGLFVHRIQNYGYYDEKPWYHEDMDC